MSSQNGQKAQGRRPALGTARPDPPGLAGPSAALPAVCELLQGCVMACARGMRHPRGCMGLIL